MASKLRLITDLYGETITQISKNPDEWMSFLECAAMNYKYPFNDQVLIYAQRPQAVACAKIEAWNKQVGRWINRGAKGIALLSEDNGYTNLRYVFDIADTNSKFGKSFRLWSVSKPYELDIIESLENKYGELEDKSSLGLAIKSVSKIIVEDNMQDYLEDLMFYRENSSLESLDEDGVKALFQNALSNSIAFSMIKRCGLNPNEYFTHKDFVDILSFNSYDTITRIGVATSEISEMGLREIYNTIKNLRINEINKIRTFDIDNDLSYDVSEAEILLKGGIIMITYTRQGDYEIPDLAIPENKIQVEGKYAMMRLRYLKENKKSLYTTLLMSNSLPEHLMNIQETAMERVEQIVSEMKEKEKITENLKATDPMKWVGLMNNLKTSAEEIVANELIYA